MFNGDDANAVEEFIALASETLSLFDSDSNGKLFVDNLLQWYYDTAYFKQGQFVSLYKNYIRVSLYSKITSLSASICAIPNRGSAKKR